MCRRRRIPGGADGSVGAQLLLGGLDMLAADTATSFRMVLLDLYDCRDYDLAKAVMS
jgi:hypothetical protein